MTATTEDLIVAIHRLGRCLDMSDTVELRPIMGGHWIACIPGDLGQTNHGQDLADALAGLYQGLRSKVEGRWKEHVAAVDEHLTLLRLPVPEWAYPQAHEPESVAADTSIRGPI